MTKLCTYKMHVRPHTHEYFYRDSKRLDGFDVWCKRCRKEWRAKTPRMHRSDFHIGPIILTLPPRSRWPMTANFNSGTRRMADDALKEGRIVVVTTNRETSVWLWRKWDTIAYPTLESFYEEHLQL